MNGWTWYWLGWFVISLTAFLIPESIALATRNHNTLSENIWRMEGFIPGQSVVDWTAIHFLFIGGMFVFMVWLFVHFGFGLWRT